MLKGLCFALMLSTAVTAAQADEAAIYQQDAKIALDEIKKNLMNLDSAVYLPEYGVLVLKEHINVRLDDQDAAYAGSVFESHNLHLKVVYVTSRGYRRVDAPVSTSTSDLALNRLENIQKNSLPKLISSE